MLDDFQQRVREEVLKEIEYCLPIFSEKVHSVSIRYPKLRQISENVLQNRRIVPKWIMYLAPYFLPTLAKAVWILLGDEKMEEYEAAAKIYQQLLIAYLKQDLQTLTLSKSW
ncbi:MAG TPA: hypothetical protein VJ044_03610 [Candidatus Hodarchaeales archaeon]|nr:hypothetical protein [Candidatus Hodarchaeales archaeon]